MRFLFLGGTQFVGRHMVAEALARGHRVSLFSRGKTNPGLFPEAEQLVGDRNGPLDVLAGRQWDAVVDVSAYVPRVVRLAAERLKDSVAQYVLVSSGAVYDLSRMKPFGDETTPLVELPDPTTEVFWGTAYGGLKVLCERAAEEHFPGRTFIVRPSVVAGPYDPTDRIPYWVTRVARGGEVLAPGGPERPMQFVDARDLAAFTITGIERGLHGPYNTACRASTWLEFLNACKRAGRSDAEYVWVGDYAFLDTNLAGTQGHDALPMAVPPERDNVYRRSVEKAFGAGFTSRPWEETAADILAWDRTRPADEPRQAGLPPAEEKALLAQWRTRK